MTPEALRRALLALLMAPDPEARFLGWQSPWPDVVRLAAHAYGATNARPRFAASPQDMAIAEIIAPAAAWLRRTEGEAAVRMVFAWALETPPWRLAERFKCQPRTIKARTERYLNLMVGAVVNLGGRGDPFDLDPPRFAVDMHPPSDHPRSGSAPRTPLDTTGLAEPSRVWVSGAWFTNGRRHRRSPSS